MLIDSSGNLLVGKTALDGTGSRGLELRADGLILASKAGQPMSLDRTGSDGVISGFYKDGAIVGSIGVDSGSYLVIESEPNGSALILEGSDNSGTTTRLAMQNASGSEAFRPFNSHSDALFDLGSSARRFKDLYRSGSTYQTSDRSTKQDIRDLTDAERNVAVACKGLLKAFRFIDAVEKDGDDANIHFGVIAQELAEAFAAEGLDANDYQVYKSATYTDDDGNEQTRLNVCYENLLAFIISAI
jgi:hypothetical protein